MWGFLNTRPVWLLVLVPSIPAQLQHKKKQLGDQDVGFKAEFRFRDHDLSIRTFGSKHSGAVNLHILGGCIWDGLAPALPICPSFGYVSDGFSKRVSRRNLSRLTQWNMKWELG